MPRKKPGIFGPINSVPENPIPPMPLRWKKGKPYCIVTDCWKCYHYKRDENYECTSPRECRYMDLKTNECKHAPAYKEPR